MSERPDDCALNTEGDDGHPPATVDIPLPSAPPVRVAAGLPARSRWTGWFVERELEGEFVASTFTGTPLYTAGVAFCAGFVVMFSGGVLSPYAAVGSRYAWLPYGNTAIAVLFWLIGCALLAARVAGKLSGPKSIEAQTLIVYFLWTIHVAFQTVFTFLVVFPKIEATWYSVHGEQSWRFFQLFQFYFIYGLTVLVQARTFPAAMITLFGLLLQSFVGIAFGLYPGFGFVCLVAMLWQLRNRERSQRRRFLAHREAMELLQSVVVARTQVHRALGRSLPVRMLSALVDGDVQCATRDACVVSLFIDAGLSSLRPGASAADTHSQLQEFGRLVSNVLPTYGGLVVASTHGPEHVLVVFGLPEAMQRREARAVGFAGRLMASPVSAHLRIGIASGVVAGRIFPEQLMAYQLFGEAVDIAVALSEGADPGSALVTKDVDSALAHVQYSYTTAAPIPILNQEGAERHLPVIQLRSSQWRPVRFDDAIADDDEQRQSSHHRTALSRASRRAQTDLARRQRRLLRDVVAEDEPIAAWVDVTAVRESLLEFRNSFFLTFAQPHIERLYEADSALAFTQTGRSLWLAVLPWYAVMLVQVIIDAVPNPAVYVLFSLCVVSCAACYALQPFPRLATTRPLLAARLDSACFWAVAAAAQSGFMLLLGQSEMGVDGAQNISTFVLWCLAALRGPVGMNWLVFNVVLSIAYFALVAVSTVVPALPWSLFNVITLGFTPVIFAFLMYRTDYSERVRFVETFVSAVAVGEAEQERENIAALMRRCTPPFLVDSVLAWLPDQPNRPFVRWLAHPDVVTLRVHPAQSVMRESVSLMSVIQAAASCVFQVVAATDGKVCVLHVGDCLRTFVLLQVPTSPESAEGGGQHRLAPFEDETNPLNVEHGAGSSTPLIVASAAVAVDVARCVDTIRERLESQYAVTVTTDETSRASPAAAAVVNFGVFDTRSWLHVPPPKPQTAALLVGTAAEAEIEAAAL